MPAEQLGGAQSSSCTSAGRGHGSCDGKRAKSVASADSGTGKIDAGAGSGHGTRKSAASAVSGQESSLDGNERRSMRFSFMNKVRRALSVGSSGVFISESDIDIHIGHNITQFDDPLVRRAVSMPKALSCFGRLFQSSRGSAQTFELSREVDKIEVFISHNWSTPRIPKFLTLAYHFNFNFGLLTSALVVVPVALCIGLLGEPDPAKGFFSGRSPLKLTNPQGHECTIVAGFAFLATLLFGHDLQSWCGRRSVPVFVDKACIHQTDERIQRQGIERLSAFLMISDSLFIVYTDTYLRKCWTVYEVASMLILHPRGHIKVVPTCLTKVIWVTLAALPLYAVVAEISGTSQDNVGLSLGFLWQKLTSALIVLPVMVTLRYWSKSRAAIDSTVQAFSIRSAQCTVEDDRKLVYRNISGLMRAADLVDADASEDAALDAFDSMAKEFIPHYLRYSWGRAGLPTAVALGFLPSCLGLFADCVCYTPGLDRHPELVFSLFCGCAFYGVSLMPLALVFGIWLASFQIHLTGCKEVVLIIVVWVLCTTIMILVAVANSVLMQFVARDPAMLGVQVLWTAIWSAATMFFFWPRRLPEDLAFRARHGSRQVRKLQHTLSQEQGETAVPRRSLSAERDDDGCPCPNADSTHVLTI